LAALSQLPRGVSGVVDAVAGDIYGEIHPGTPATLPLVSVETAHMSLSTHGLSQNSRCGRTDG